MESYIGRIAEFKQKRYVPEDCCYFLYAYDGEGSTRIAHTGQTVLILSNFYEDRLCYPICDVLFDDEVCQLRLGEDCSFDNVLEIKA